MTNTDPLFEVKDRNITKKNVSNTDPHYGLEKRISPSSTSETGEDVDL